MKITDGAKIFIKNDALNKFLFVLRDNKLNIPHPDMWGLLGGGIEPGESPLVAVRRELSEEINIDVFDIKEIYSKKITHNIEGTLYEIMGYYFVGKTSTADLSAVVLNEGQKVSFFSLEEITLIKNVSPSIKELISVCKKDLMS